MRTGLDSLALTLVTVNNLFFPHYVSYRACWLCVPATLATKTATRCKLSSHYSSAFTNRLFILFQSWAPRFVHEELLDSEEMPFYDEVTDNETVMNCLFLNFGCSNVRLLVCP